jgi:hypothetical protein
MTEKRRLKPTDELVVQLRVQGGAEENEYRSSLTAALEALFHHTSLGQVGGTDIGADKFNIFISNVHPDNWDQALSLVLKELDRQQLRDDAVVARGTTWENDTDEWDEYQVVWPPNSETTFSIW